MTGEVDDLEDLFDNAPCGYLAAGADRRITKVNSNFACGTAVIARAHGPVPEVIDHGVSGFVVSSVQEVVAAANGADTLDRSAIRKRFEQRFTAARMARHYLAACRRLPALRQTPQTPMLFQKARVPSGCRYLLSVRKWALQAQADSLLAASERNRRAAVTTTQELSPCAARHQNPSATSST
jgi:hypothetical protein